MDKEKIRHYVSDILIGGGTDGIKDGLLQIFADELLSLEEIVEISREFRQFLADEGWEEPASIKPAEIPWGIENLGHKLEELKPRLRKLVADLPYDDPLVYVSLLIIIEATLRKILEDKNSRGN